VEELGREKEKVLSFLESVLNNGMRRIVTTVFGADTKSPRIDLGENSYSFEVYEDTGTGTAYASLVVLSSKAALGNMKFLTVGTLSHCAKNRASGFPSALR
jgi:hypothetical protein